MNCRAPMIPPSVSTLTSAWTLSLEISMVVVIPTITASMLCSQTTSFPRYYQGECCGESGVAHALPDEYEGKSAEHQEPATIIMSSSEWDLLRKEMMYALSATGAKFLMPTNTMSPSLPSLVPGLPRPPFLLI